MPRQAGSSACKLSQRSRLVPPDPLPAPSPFNTVSRGGPSMRLILGHRPPCALAAFGVGQWGAQERSKGGRRGKPALIPLKRSLLGHPAVCDQGSKFTASVRQPLPVRSVGTVAIAAGFRLQQQPPCLLPLHIFINSPFVSEPATTLCCISAIHLARLS